MCGLVNVHNLFILLFENGGFELLDNWNFAGFVTDNNTVICKCITII